jgi:hypothetical protein
MSRQSSSEPSKQPGDECKEGHQGRKWPRKEKEQKWWGTDYYSWSDRSTRLIGIAEAQQSYTVSLLQISRYSTPDDNVGREHGAPRRRAQKKGVHVILYYGN